MVDHANLKRFALPHFVRNGDFPDRHFGTNFVRDWLYIDADSCINHTMRLVKHIPQVLAAIADNDDAFRRVFREGGRADFTAAGNSM